MDIGATMISKVGGGAGESIYVWGGQRLWVHVSIPRKIARISLSQCGVERSALGPLVGCRATPRWGSGGRAPGTSGGIYEIMGFENMNLTH